MLSITDLLDFIDLDSETVHIVSTVIQRPVEESAVLASQFLATANGILILHHMFRDQIGAATAADPSSSRTTELRQAYARFARKYPLPHLL